MKKSLLIGLSAVFVGSALQAQEEAAVIKEIERAREVIAQYVNTRQEIARVKNEWNSYRELTERRIGLYASEIEQLEKAIQTANEETTQAEREIAKIKEDIAGMRAANAVVGDALPAIENRMRELNQFFPRPLKSKVQRLVQQLGKARQASERMAIVIGILNEVDKFNANFNFDTDERTLPSGETKLVDVIYVGLAGAFYADREGTIGGRLVPAAGQWEWIEDNTLAPSIRSAISYYEGEVKPAMLVDLPIELKTISIAN